MTLEQIELPQQFDAETFATLANDPKMYKRKGDLADAMGVRAGAISEIISGKRTLSYDEAVRAWVFLSEVVHGGRKRKVSFVPLRGYVGAGAAMIAFAEGDDPAEEVSAPSGATESTVAVEVRGESLGALFDRWLVFYDEVRKGPTASMLGKLCVVGLADGRILVKQLKRGQIDGHYNLLSNIEPPIYDQIVVWAAIVKQMTPR